MAWDVVVIGLGAMGSAAACHLAKRGQRVLGLEQFSPAHDRGSSHGLSRMIRQAYFEHPAYVPLVLRAYELWRDLERECGRELLRQTGALMIGPEESPIVRGSRESALAHGLAHRMLGPAELSGAYPFMRFGPRDVALQEDAAGVLFPEDALLSFQESARRSGAELRFGVKARIGEHPARCTVVTAGAWLPDLVPGLPMKVERQVLHWFDPVSDGDRIPLFIRDTEGPPLYVIPGFHGEGTKAAFHHGGETSHPDRLRRDVSVEEVSSMRRRLEATIPALNGPLRRSAVCMYTNTPDEHFAIGFPPGRPDVLAVSPCSGHGFKFAPVIGEIVADLVAEGGTRHPLELFDLARFFRSG